MDLRLRLNAYFAILLNFPQGMICFGPGIKKLYVPGDNLSQVKFIRVLQWIFNSILAGTSHKTIRRKIKRNEFSGERLTASS